MTKRTGLQPYRTPQPPDGPPAEPEAALTTVADLGSLRSSHAPTLLVAPSSRASVDLHSGGLVFRDAKSERAIAFDDIDELWFEQVSGGEIESVRIVTHERETFRIETRLERSADIFFALERRCSQPLQRLALEAIARGERLTFGKYDLDAAGLDAPDWSLRWEQLSLVRVALGTLAIFRGKTLLPSHSVRFDEVPHPWIFWALVEKLAPRTEVDNPLRFLRPPSEPSE